MMKLRFLKTAAFLQSSLALSLVLSSPGAFAQPAAPAVENTIDYLSVAEAAKKAACRPLMAADFLRPIKYSFESSVANYFCKLIDTNAQNVRTGQVFKDFASCFDAGEKARSEGLPVDLFEETRFSSQKSYDHGKLNWKNQLLTTAPLEDCLLKQYYSVDDYLDDPAMKLFFKEYLRKENIKINLVDISNYPNLGLPPKNQVLEKASIGAGISFQAVFDKGECRVVDRAKFEKYFAASKEIFESLYADYQTNRTKCLKPVDLGVLPQQPAPASAAAPVDSAASPANNSADTAMPKAEPEKQPAVADAITVYPAIVDEADAGVAPDSSTDEKPLEPSAEPTEAPAQE